jgi:hypothetical protein
MFTSTPHIQYNIYDTTTGHSQPVVSSHHLRLLRILR